MPQPNWNLPVIFEHMADGVKFTDAAAFFFVNMRNGHIKASEIIEDAFSTLPKIREKVLAGEIPGDIANFHTKTRYILALPGDVAYGTYLEVVFIFGYLGEDAAGCSIILAAPFICTPYEYKSVYGLTTAVSLD